MCFEVGALRVGFPTANIVTRVCGDSLPWPGAPSTFRLWFLRQTVPAGDHEGLCGVRESKITVIIIVTIICNREKYSVCILIRDPTV